MEKIFHIGRKIIPSKIFSFLQPAYHYLMAIIGVLIYRFPSKEIKVIGVTGTKGKSTTVEIIGTILEEAGYKTALSNTIRFKIGQKSEPNMYKMSMPGRFFVQKFLRKAVNENCDYIIIEMTSQGVLQYRHKFIELDAFIFTNLSPEHIESHGSYENYREAKLEIAKLLNSSKKRPRILIVNEDDKESSHFLNINAEVKKTFSIKNKNFDSPLQGDFNQYNIAGAVSLCEALGINEDTIKRAVRNFKEVKGRVEKIDEGQDFTVIVDYSHTADSMEKLYKTFENGRKICVFAATGGGRDKWKRPEMGKVADTYCDEIILTNDDPYDEDPIQIIQEIKTGIKKHLPSTIIDRREAIKQSLKLARKDDVVLITGKGTDPYLMGPNGKKIPWNDGEITREELRKII